MSADEKDKDPLTDDLFEEVDEVEEASATDLPEANETDAIELADDELEELEPAEAETMSEPEPVEESDPFADFGEPGEPDESPADSAPDAPAETPASDPMDLFDDPDEPGESDGSDVAADASDAWDADDQFAEPGEPDEAEAVEVEEPPASTAALFDDGEAPDESSDPVEPAQDGGFEEEYSITGKVRRSIPGGGDWKERKGLIAAVAGVVLLAFGGGAFVFLGGSEPEVTDITLPSAQQMPAPTDVAPDAEPSDELAGEDLPTEPAAPEPVGGDEPAVAEEPDAPEEPAAPEPPAVEEPVAAKEPPPEPLGPASEIVEVTPLANGNVLIRGDGEFRAVKYFGMKDPNRVVVDVYGVERGFSTWNQAGEGAVRRIRPGIHPDRMRFVLDLAESQGALPAYSIEREGNEVLVVVGR